MKNMIKHTGLVVALVCIAVGIYGQDANTIKKELSKAKHDTVRVKLLQDFAWNMQYVNPDSSLILAKQAYGIAVKIKWQKGMGTALSEMGWYYYLKSDFKTGLIYCDKAMRVFDRMIASTNKRMQYEGKMGKSSVYSNSASIDVAQGNYPRGLDRYLKGLRINEALKLEKRLGTNYLNIGGVYGQTGNIDMAETYYKKAMAIAEKQDNPQLISIVTGCIGNIHLERHAYDKAIDYFSRSVEIMEKYGQGSMAAIFILNIGICNIEKKEPLKGIPYLEKALPLLKATGDLNNTAILYNNLGKANYFLGKHVMAETYLRKAHQLADSIQSLKTLGTIEHDLSNVYLGMNKPELALEHFTRYVELKDSITNEKNARKQVQSEMQYQFEKNKTTDSLRVAVLDQQKKRDRNREVKQQQTYLFIGLAAFFLMLGVALFAFRAYNQQKKNNKLIAFQKLLVDEKQKEIIDSIHYAKRIQQALLPGEKYITRSLQKNIK